jgi:ClpP class serine protease
MAMATTLCALLAAPVAGPVGAIAMLSGVAGVTEQASAFAKRARALQAMTPRSVCAVALYGVLVPEVPEDAPRAARWAFTATTLAAARLRAAALDDRCTAIMLDVDSPGGSVHGVRGLAAAIAEVATRKPVYAIANRLALGAAYVAASAASHLYMTRTGCIGALGVHSMTRSAGSRAPTSAALHAFLRQYVDDEHQALVRAVAHHRRGHRHLPGTATLAAPVARGVDNVREIGASEALALGLADGERTLEQTLTEARGRP